MSYASEIENRAIFQNWQSYSRNVGRLCIRGISEQSSNARIWVGSHRIGSEVCFKSNMGNAQYYNNPENNGADWLFRCYVDGTAYFYPDKVRRFGYYTTSESIKDVVYAHYRVIKEIYDENKPYYERKFQVLRRKPVGALSNKHFIKTLQFGEFLLNKYNDLEGGEE